MKRVVPFIRVLTIVTLIVFLFLTAIRFLLSPLFLEIEYRMPGFPDDPYGFTFEERMQFARVSVAYLVMDQEIEFLEAQEISAGVPLYNERELQHMFDVKVLVQKALITWYVAIAVLILLGLFSGEYKIAEPYWEAISRGGLWAIGLILLIIFGVILNFDTLFTVFHRIFFEGDTWLFRYSDSLIRLFPIRFWQDAFITVGIIASAGGILFFFIGRRYARKYNALKGQPD